MRKSLEIGREYFDKIAKADDTEKEKHPKWVVDMEIENWKEGDQFQIAGHNEKGEQFVMIGHVVSNNGSSLDLCLWNLDERQRLVSDPAWGPRKGSRIDSDVEITLLKEYAELGMLWKAVYPETPDSTK